MAGAILNGVALGCSYYINGYFRITMSNSEASCWICHELPVVVVARGLHWRATMVVAGSCGGTMVAQPIPRPQPRKILLTTATKSVLLVLLFARQ